MKVKIGTVLRDPQGFDWVVVDRVSYTASAHNDRWTDYHTTLRRLSRKGLPIKKTKQTTTDDSLSWWEVVGTAEMTVGSITYMEK